MARQKDSSPSVQVQAPAGEGSPVTVATPATENREQFIPRERFDEVIAERNQLRLQAQQVPQFQPQAFQPQQAPQGFSPTGMVGNQPPQQAPQPAANVPNFDDPTVQKQWRDKIANNPVTGLREIVSLMIQTEGGPLLEQFRQQISSQITPIQQSFVQQQLTSYTSQRQQADPSFATTVAPRFNQLVTEAVNRGYNLTPQALQAIEGIARAQTGSFTQPQAPRQVPFTEAPGGAANFGQTEQVQLTPQQRAMADRFGMTYAEYAASQRRNDG